jgi:hypothetical protein
MLLSRTENGWMSIPWIGLKWRKGFSGWGANGGQKQRAKERRAKGKGLKANGKRQTEWQKVGSIKIKA